MVPKLFHPCGNALRRRVSLLRQASATTECEDIQQNSTGIDDQKVDEKSCCDQILNCQSVICFCQQKTKNEFRRWSKAMTTTDEGVAVSASMNPMRRLFAVAPNSSGFLRIFVSEGRQILTTPRKGVVM
jgi:hypothetical protein